MDLDTLSPDATGLAKAYRASLDWWRLAGVDADFSDEPAAWVRQSEATDSEPIGPGNSSPSVASYPAPSPLPKASMPPPGEDGREWPCSLEAFQKFWMQEPSIDPGALADRVPPRGIPEARLMVLVGQPEEEDRRVLLSGPEGRMMEAILQAAGLAENDIYCASALPRLTPMPDWNALALAGLGAFTRHHIAIVKPQRLIVFGRSLAPLFGGSAGAQYLDMESGSAKVPMLLAPALATLLRSGGQRKRFWTNWLEWTR